MKKILLAFSVILLGITGEACAQVVMNPTKVTFTASPDHNASITDPDTGISTPVLDHYELSAVVTNQLGILLFTQGIGKPTPDAMNNITVNLAAVFLNQLTKNATYKAVVSAVGPSGTSTSAPSNTFSEAAAPQSTGKPNVSK